MPINAVRLGTLQVSQLMLGGNPFSGVSHQSAQASADMLDYFTAERIKQAWRQAEQAGITTFIGRADRHITRTLREYWNEGGTIKWIAQTCPEYVSIARSVQEAIGCGAKAVYVHGGHMDNLLKHGQLELAQQAIDQIHAAGLPAGVAGHNPQVFHWAEQNVQTDFYMCSYYNPSDRSRNAETAAAGEEQFLPDDRDAMTSTIQLLRRPAIHYKIFAAGRNDPAQAFAYVARQLRPGDAACFGVFTKDNPNMIAQDVALFQKAMAAR